MATALRPLSIIALVLLLSACGGSWQVGQAREHVAALTRELEVLQLMVTQERLDPPAAAHIVDKEDICSRTAAVGASLFTQERPPGVSPEGWVSLKAAQRYLQLVCGEVTVRWTIQEGGLDPFWPEHRRRNADAHLRNACQALSAVARELAEPGDRC